MHKIPFLSCLKFVEISLGAQKKGINSSWGWGTGFMGEVVPERWVGIFCMDKKEKCVLFQQGSEEEAIHGGNRGTGKIPFC